MPRTVQHELPQIRTLSLCEGPFTRCGAVHFRLCCHQSVREDLNKQHAGNSLRQERRQLHSLPSHGQRSIRRRIRPRLLSHLDLQMEWPLSENFFKRLASFCRLIVFDKRGTGLSDRAGPIPTIEDRMDDVRAVMDAVRLSASSTLRLLRG